MGERLQDIFEHAVGLHTPAREEYLTSACGTDVALRAEVLGLLRVHDQAPRFLASPTAGLNAAATIAGAPREQAGQVIDRYRLLELIGEGGFGSVWAAEQKAPVKRRVALKIIKLGMDTKQVIARFEAERQALAIMDHPNIARVLDAGSTETGRPFFVMELVRGVPILEYCDREKLDTEARLALFTQVCNAIQHAHQKGIIHRDIKPSNVLVTMHDGVAVPKVIDFGIAKATNQELTEKTVYTQHRQMIGTPAYMSPEQAEMSGLDIDTRSDIYSLGVLLYELLTGTTPFDTDDLMSKGFAEMMRIIREEEPHKPSTRLSSLGATATKTAEQRRSDAKKLGLILKGDLDWIVMKCLEKDRTRRYESASGLAADIRRHLSDEPVTAGPPSAGYRLRKFVKRNRGQVIAAGVVAVALVLGVIGTTSGMVWALHEKENSQRELARANEIKRLITDMLRGVDPAIAQTADTTLLKKILADASERLSKGEVADELVAAELHHVIGGVYSNISLFSAAVPHLEKAVEIRKRLLGEEDDRTLRCMNNLGNTLWKMRRFPEAEEVWLRALEVERRVLGDANESTLATITSLGLLYLDTQRLDEALRMFETSLPISRRVLGPDHPFTAEAMGGMARAYQELGRYAEAEKLLLEAIESQRGTAGKENPAAYGFIDSLAILYGTQGRYAEAEPLFIKAIEGRRPLLGEEHTATIQAVGNLAELYRRQRRFADAEPLAVKLLALDRRVYGEEHAKTLDAMRLLADGYREQGRYAEAEPLYVKLLQIQRRVHGEEHQETLGAMHNLPIVYAGLGRYAEAETVGLRLLELERRVLGEEAEGTLGTMTNLGHLYDATGRYEDAVRMYETSLPIKLRVLGPQHPWTQAAMKGLAGAYIHLGRRAEAVSLLREIGQLNAAALDKPDAGAQALNDAAWDLLTHEMEELRDPAKALGYARRACALEEASKGGWLWGYLDTLALAQHRTGDTAAAARTQRRAISLMPRENTDPEMPKRLAEYEAALGSAEAPPGKGGPP